MDDSVKFVLQHYPSMRVVANEKNSGYAGGADQGVCISKGDYVLIMNPDIVFEPNYLDALIGRLNRDSKIGAIIGKLRQYDFAHHKKLHVIDSAGLLMFRNRRCVDCGQGEKDAGQYDVPEEVFGITGACPLYRRKALEDCKIAGEYFDTSFFMYKEDVDISWRMRLLGWKCFYEPSAVAYHGRGTGVLNRSCIWDIARSRKNLSRFVKYHSYKNERLMRVKNELLSGVLRDILPILWKEILMAGWIILREPYLFKSLGRFLLQLPAALLKRQEIMRKVRVSATEMAKWFE